METKEIIIGEFGYNEKEIRQQIRYLLDTIQYHKKQLRIWKDALKEVTNKDEL